MAIGPKGTVFVGTRDSELWAVTDTDGACRLLAGETVTVWQVEGSVPLRFTFDNAAALYADL